MTEVQCFYECSNISTYFMQNTTTIIRINARDAPVTPPTTATHFQISSTEIKLNHKESKKKKNRMKYNPLYNCISTSDKNISHF